MTTALAIGPPSGLQEPVLFMVARYTFELMKDIEEKDLDILPKEYDYFLIHTQPIFMEICNETGFVQNRKERVYTTSLHNDHSPERQYVKSLGRQAFKKRGIESSFQRMCECSNFIGLTRRLSESQKHPEYFSDQNIFKKMKTFFEIFGELASDYSNYPLTTTYP